MRKVLVLCTGNSCRSIMAEALINHHLDGSWKAYSAGVRPGGVNPWSLIALAELGVDTQGLRSKSVQEFLEREDLDLVITVCDHARESCPVFPKRVEVIHIGIEDPVQFASGKDALFHFRACRDEIKERIVDYLKGRP